MNDKMKPAIIGGVILGVLSAIPFVNIVNVCCCAWALLGGALAVNFYVKSSTRPATTADGAVLGLLAGVVGGIVYVILGVPLTLAFGNAMGAMMSNIVAQSDPAQAEAIRAQMAASTSVAGALFNGIIGAIVLAIFATIGGLIGVAIFEKRKGGTMPPPPAPGGFDATGGGYGGPAAGGGSYGGPAAGGGSYGQGM
jgi:hypothetical protein